MPALDQCHEQIVRALEKAGWHVQPKPFTFAIAKGHTLQIDIEAERHDEDNFQTIIIVEVKCFPSNRADTEELYSAIGQYLVYKSLLIPRGQAEQLYLAIPENAYRGVFQRMGMAAVREYGVKMIVVDVESEEIVEWLG